MTEELKACAECGAPEGYVSGERFMAEHERVRELRAEIAALRAKASQGGEAVAAQSRWRRPEIGRPDWSVWQPAVVSTSNPAWTIDSQGFEVEYRLLYTHPADQVADDLTMVKVSRELLEQIAVELEHDNDRYFLGRELRALLNGGRV